MKRPTVTEDPLDVVDEDTGLSPRQKTHLRDRLLAELEQVQRRASEHVGTAIEEEGRLVEEMDLASRDQDQAFLLRLADKERKLIAEIRDALRRFEDGTYGICEGTGEPIGFRRLDARPWAKHSVAYKELLEKEKLQRRPV